MSGALGRSATGKNRSPGHSPLCDVDAVGAGRRAAEQREHKRQVSRKYKATHPLRILLCDAKRRAQRKGVEFDLLEALIRAAGRIVSREDLVKSILGRNFTPYDRSIDTHVSNLRKKLGHYSDGVERIKTIRGVGYIYARPSDAAKETP